MGDYSLVHNSDSDRWKIYKLQVNNYNAFEIKNL